MKHLITNIVIITSSLTVLPNIALSTELFTYDINRSQPCTRDCVGNINVTGTVTVNALGSLETENVVNWNLVFNSTNFSDTVINPDNSFFHLTNSASVEANDTELNFIGASGSLLVFSDTVPAPFGVVWQFSSSVSNPSLRESFLNAPRLFSSEPSDRADGNIPELTPITVGTRIAKAVPEPSSIIGLGLLATFGIRTKFKSKKK